MSVASRGSNPIFKTYAKYAYTSTIYFYFLLPRINACLVGGFGE